MWPSDVTLFPKFFTLTDWAYSLQANPWEIEELWKNFGCRGQVTAVSMTNPFPDEKFGMNTSAGFSEEPGIRKGISLTGPQAAAEQASKRQSLMALCRLMFTFKNDNFKPSFHANLPS